MTANPSVPSTPSVPSSPSAPSSPAAGASPLPDLPPGWRAVGTRGPGPFVTHAVLEGPGGERVEWTSRRHRKRLGLRGPGEARAAPVARAGRVRPRPTAESWWIGGLFAVGSACFALGSMPAYFDRVSAGLVAWTFFVGSVFFTTAALVQLREALRAPTGVAAGSPRPRGLRALVGWHPRRIDVWATAVQLVGTVFFNVSTFTATRADLTVGRERALIWAPDVVGSVCFLVASWLAYAEVNRGVLPRTDRSVGWAVAALNLLGSIAFGLAAVGARYLHTTGEPANLALVNGGTFLGAVCFLVGAALLPVESARDAARS